MNKSSTIQPLAAALLLSLTGLACNNTLPSTAVPGEGTESQDGAGDGKTGSGGDGTGDGAGDGSDGDGSDGAGPGASNGTPESCDGLDNDGNGIIDDVDAAGDGVCDCLRIATLGFAGIYGNGDVFNNWLNGKSTNGATALEDQALTPELLSQFDVIVVQDVRSNAGGPGMGHGIGREYGAAEVQALEDWIHARGGMMTLIGYGSADESTNVNRLLAPYGMSYVQTQILSGGSGSGGTVAISNWAAHPLSENVSKVGVDNGYPVSGGSLRIAWETDAQSVTHDVARATVHGNGHVFVWGDEWITYDSEWTGRPDYQLERLWLNSLKWLSPANQCQVALPTIG